MCCHNQMNSAVASLNRPASSSACASAYRALMFIGSVSYFRAVLPLRKAVPMAILRCAPSGIGFVRQGEGPAQLNRWTSRAVCVVASRRFETRPSSTGVAVEIQKVAARPRRSGPTLHVHAPLAVRPRARDDASLPWAQPACAAAQSFLLLRFVLSCRGHPAELRRMWPHVNAERLNRRVFGRAA
jgi:hypothetical protein